MRKIVFMLTIFLIVSFGFPKHYIMKVNLSNGTTDTIRVADISKIYFELTPIKVDERKMPNIAGSFNISATDASMGSYYDNFIVVYGWPWPDDFMANVFYL